MQIKVKTCKHRFCVIFFYVTARHAKTGLNEQGMDYFTLFCYVPHAVWILKYNLNIIFDAHPLSVKQIITVSQIAYLLLGTNELVYLIQLRKHDRTCYRIINNNILVSNSAYSNYIMLYFVEWTQRDLERSEIVKFCRQYIVFHDDKSIVYSGPSGNCTEIKGE